MEPGEGKTDEVRRGRIGRFHGAMKLLAAIRCAGCAEHQSEAVRRGIQVTNATVMFGTLGYLGYAAFWALLDAHGYLPVILINCISAPLLWMAVWLNRQREHLAAAVTLNLLLTVPIFASLYFLLGSGVGNHFLFIAFSLLPVITLGQWNRTTAASLAGLNVIALVLMIAWPSPAILSEMAGPVVRDFMYVFTVLLTMTLVLVLFFASHAFLVRREADIDRLRTELEATRMEVRRRTIMDGLTGCFNRTYLENRLQQEVLRGERYGSVMSAILFDLDGFRHLNDTFGHDAGDRLLKLAAETITPVVRAADCLGRWGGDEFLLMMPETDLAAALNVAEKLRESLAAKEVEESGSISACFGVAERKSGEEGSTFCKRLTDTTRDAAKEGRGVIRTSHG